jgi:RNA polymerase sigma factor (TIGR02999 family)
MPRVGSVAAGNLTDLLLRWQQGDAAALDDLITLLYDDLKKLAHRCLRNERAGHTLQTTALVNEAYLRLTRAKRMHIQDRTHFFAFAAVAMRRILVDEARKRGNQKRGGARIRVTLEEAQAFLPERNIEVLALDQALTRLAKFSPRKCRVIELRFFAGLSIEECAEALNVSTDVVKREWRTAKLWLLKELDEAGDGSRAVESD